MPRTEEQKGGEKGDGTGWGRQEYLKQALTTAQSTSGPMAIKLLTLRFSSWHYEACWSRVVAKVRRGLRRPAVKRFAKELGLIPGVSVVRGIALANVRYREGK